jgi:hypothetical protein
LVALVVPAGWASFILPWVVVGGVGHDDGAVLTLSGVLKLGNLAAIVVYNGLLRNSRCLADGF